MPYSTMVVEGPHDAAFIGVLLRERGLRKIEFLAEVDTYWDKLIPKTFPSSPKGRLGHVVGYPDIYETTKDGSKHSVAILVAGGDTRLVSELQTALEILDISQLNAAAIVIDADDVGVENRVNQLLKELAKVNSKKEDKGTPGFPLTLPAAPGIAGGKPRIGIHVLPDNVNTGALETVLLECAKASYTLYREPAIDFVKSMEESSASETDELAHLRNRSDWQKAAVGIIGNLHFPGSALSVAVERGSWLQRTNGTEAGLIAIRKFLDVLLS
jgi:hypothetical protein